MVQRIDHIELIVRDVEAHIALFERLGFQVLTRTQHHGVSAELRLPGADQPIFEIHQVSGEENPGVNHIAFTCADVEAAHRDLVAEGVRFEHRPHVVKETGRLIANFRDPDGWRLQLVDARRADPSV